jgi:hypothetical protein
MANTDLHDDSEFIKVSPKELKQILLDHAAAGEAVGIEGPPGCGKTEIVMQVAKEVGKPFLSPFNCVLSDGVDMKGIPSFSEDRTSAHWVKDKRWLQAVEYATTILADELSQGNIGSINSMAPVFQEKRIDDIYLHPDTWPVWTGNRAQDKCGTTRVPAQLYNRCYMYELSHSAKDHVEYELTQPNVDLLTVRYLRMKGDAAYKFDPALKINSTPRAWSTIARKLFTNPNASMATIAGRIGRGFATELMAFRDLAPQLPSQEEVLLGPQKARVPESVSAQFLITDMLADISSVNSFDALVTYAKRLPAEMQAKFVKDSLNRHPEVAGTKAFVDWGVKFADVLR